MRKVNGKESRRNRETYKTLELKIYSFDIKSSLKCGKETNYKIVSFRLKL